MEMLEFVCLAFVVCEFFLEKNPPKNPKPTKKILVFNICIPRSSVNMLILIFPYLKAIL